MTEESKKPLHILVVTTYFYPQSGGVANHTYNLNKKLLERFPIQITVVAAGKTKKERSCEMVDGMKVYRLPYWIKVSNTPINPIWYLDLKRLIAKESPDIVSVHTPVPFLADMAGFAKGTLPMLLKYHHAGSMQKGSLPMDLVLRLYEATLFKLLARKAHTVISASEYTRTHFLKQFGNTITITTGVDVSRFGPKHDNTGNSVLFVASLNKAEQYKGLEYLLRAVKKLIQSIPDIHVTVVGDGDNRMYYEDMSRSLGLDSHISFRGRLYAHDLVEVYRSSSVLVHPSFMESCPNVLLEAMACQLPVIGTNSTGTKDLIIDGKNGFLFPPKDVSALAQAIQHILTDTELSLQMGQFGYDWVKSKFSWDKKADETYRVIWEALGL